MANLRDFVFDLLKDDAILNAVNINEDSMFNGNDVDTPNVRPMMVFRWGATSVGMNKVNIRSLEVWVHNSGTDYEVIDFALKRVRTVLTGLEAVSTGTDDEWLSQVIWDGDSDDLDDDVQRTVTRNAAFRFIGSAA